MKNTYEVGFTPDDNNDRNLPGSVQHPAERGDSAYHHLNMAVPGPLDAGDTGGVVGMPTVGSGYGMDGNMSPSLNSNVSVHNEGTTLNTTASEENLSKKYKYPQVHQDIPEKGNPSVQYSDHT